jgi:hypothetical protein
MPGEIPPGVDPETYVHEGIRAIKRPVLHAFVEELVHPEALALELVKGDPDCKYLVVVYFDIN